MSRSRCPVPALFLAVISLNAYCAADPGAQNDAGHALARRRMVEEQLASRDIRDGRVLQAMRRVPRHLFVPPALRPQAYEDYPLPIGEGQTISQPYIVALMTECLELGPGDRVLEVGTGSGYQAAVLAEMGARVYSIEINPALAERASRPRGAGLQNVRVRPATAFSAGRGARPFDAIIVTCAAPDNPPRPHRTTQGGGRLIIPLENGPDPRC